MALREFIPMHEAAASIANGLDCVKRQGIEFLVAKVHRDDQGAMLSANLKLVQKNLDPSSGHQNQAGSNDGKNSFD